MSSGRQFSAKIRTAAATLARLVEEPEFAGQTWTWDKIGAVLELNRRESQQVIYYLRDNATNFAWTIGTRASNWETMPTTSGRAYLDGQINQDRHYLTRTRTAMHAATVLSTVDPDPRMARVFKARRKMFARILEDVADAMDTLIEIRAGA